MAAQPPTSRASAADPVWTPEQAAEYLAVAEDTLRYWRYVGRGPKYHRLAGKLVRYRKSQLDAFVEASTVDPTEPVVPVARRKRARPTP